MSPVALNPTSIKLVGAAFRVIVDPIGISETSLVYVKRVPNLANANEALVNVDGQSKVEAPTSMSLYERFT